MSFTTCSAGSLVVTGFFIIFKSMWVKMSRKPSATQSRESVPWAPTSDIRQATNLNDPRQRGLFGAAWMLGYFTDFAAGGAVSVALGGAIGPFGLAAATADYPQPWFEENGGVSPAFHILRGLSRLHLTPLHYLGLAPSAPVAAIAAASSDGVEIWVANMRATPTDISFQSPVKGAILNADSFAMAANDPTFMDHLNTLPTTLRLDAFAVARILIGN
jgi:hypothetical protein